MLTVHICLPYSNIVLIVNTEMNKLMKRCNKEEKKNKSKQNKTENKSKKYKTIKGKKM